MIPTADGRPYIIVDDQKLYPIERSSASRPAKRDQNRLKARPFGVVDRVTISESGRERCRQYYRDGYFSSDSGSGSHNCLTVSSTVR
jgi:hypothetical protein